MCIDPSKPTLNASIEVTVNKLIADKKTFSAHDVTKALREEVNAGLNATLDQGETGSVHVNGVDVPKISHDYVRDAVHELFHTGKMTGYDRNHSGSHWEYAPAVVAPPVPVLGTPVDPSTSTPPASSGGSYDGSPTL